ncbi:hypothetical protein [Aquimarina algiphila]|uniref:Uncharacterized protein n=1 Tax=Aquimarina algiphila TaxID=2047982 RepID=A0A554VAT1_9FLAO|nr:hypothetical protein [Aquimarina algiphila]TSE03393.1 hypothetical protein FOF46_29440 [Aquimarina algiphila]
MNLHCSTTWPDKMGKLKGEQTVFVPQILNSLYHNGLITADEITDYERRYYETTGLQFLCSERQKPHTIRWDKNNRWKSGMDIHFKIWTGSPYRSKTFQFAPVLMCTGVQEIEIIYSDEKLSDLYCMEPVVKIDGRPLTLEEVEKLAINDGFTDVQKFCWWFNKDFTGKIIHWTDLKY